MRQGEEFDRALVNVELLEVEHARAFRGATVPAAYGLSLGHDHVMPVRMPQPILKAVTGWFRIHLADDQAARPLFYDACSLCSDSTWRMETANLK
jgi:hypothetical protein